MITSEAPEDEKQFREALNKLRTFYTNAVNSGEGDRIQFETVLNELVVLKKHLEIDYTQKLDALRQELCLEKKQKDKKIEEWKNRFEKLQKRWNEIMVQLDTLQKDKEEVRQQRDILLCSETKKKLLEQMSSFNEFAVQKRIFQDFVNTFLYAVTEELNADRGSVFVWYPPTDELMSIALKPPLSNPTKNEIRIPSRKGIAGTVFKTGEALNILNAYADNRFYRDVDKETGYVTRVVLCYPLYSPKTGNIIGVLQLINKKTEQGIFTVQDEAKCAEYASIISYIIDSVPHIYNFDQSIKPFSSFSDGNLTESRSSLQSSMESDSKPQLKRKGSYIAVKRIGHRRKSKTEFTLEKPNSLVPQDIEDYIKKLEQCWRKAVGEAADLKNKISNYEQEMEEMQTKLNTFQKRALELETLNKETREKMMNHQKEFKKQKQQWEEKERELKEKILELKKANEEQMGDAFASGQSTPEKGSPKKEKTNGYLPYLEIAKTRRFYLDNVPTTRTTVSNPIPPKVISEKPIYREVFLDVFNKCPTPMCILSKSYRIWRANLRFLELVECSEQELLGTPFSDLALGVDRESLPRLLQFDVIQGLGLKKIKFGTLTERPKKNFVKVNIHLSRLGSPGQKYQHLQNQVVKAPIYILVFSKNSEKM